MAKAFREWGTKKKEQEPFHTTSWGHHSMWPGHWANYRIRPCRPGSHAKGSFPAHTQWPVSNGHPLFTGTMDSHKWKLTLSYNRTPLSLVRPRKVWVDLFRPDQPDSATIPIQSWAQIPLHDLWEKEGGVLLWCCEFGDNVSKFSLVTQNNPFTTGEKKGTHRMKAGENDWWRRKQTGFTQL